MQKIRFTVDGKPIGKQRPRFARVGGYVKTYTPKKTQDYENNVKLAFLSQLEDSDYKEYSGRIKVVIWAFFMPPKSYSKKKFNELLEMEYLKKPDADNIAKIICDALNGTAWKDDSQIYELEVHKHYDEEDKVIIEIEYEE